MRQPSPKNAYVKWSIGLKSALLNLAANIFSARAIPTAFPRPWPRGPVVVSIPISKSNSGCPGVLDPSCLKFLISSIDKL